MSKSRRKPEERVLYVYYDRVCPKEVKKRAIARRFGAQYGMPTSDTPQAKSAPAKGVSHSAPSGAPANSYVYHPGRAQGGEAVRERPLKLLLTKAVSLIETLEERSKRDERIAKERAVALKKWQENRRIFFTSLVLLVLIAVFLFLAYQVFFVIDTVNVDGSGLYTDAEVVDAAGFREGDTLYSFSAGEAEENITFRCPYIKSAEIDRSIPKSVNVALEDDEAVFYADIWGDCVKLSAGLRVLEVSPMQNAVTDGLAEVILPPVSSSVGGRPLIFAEARDERYIRVVLGEALRSELGTNGRITRLDLSDKYHLTLLVDGKYAVRMGEEEDCDLKLKLAAKTIASSEFDSTRDASIDVESADHAIVRYINAGIGG